VKFIGVTGHRDLNEEDRLGLEKAVHACMAEIESFEPSRNHCLVTGLAAGADQLVAQCALNRGWTLNAVLAASVDAFALTMSTIDAQRLRNELLPKCSAVAIAPQDHQDEISGYVAVALAIAQKTESLIALWDGMKSRGEGGTADTVSRFLDSKLNADRSIRSRKTVYWVRTRRFGDQSPSYKTTWEKLYR